MVTKSNGYLHDKRMQKTSGNGYMTKDNWVEKKTKVKIVKETEISPYN